MQQVDKKNYMSIFITSLISLFVLIGCSSKNEYSSSIKYFDQNITKDKLLHAAKRVFHLSDENAFIIDSYRNDLNVTKTKASYRLYKMAIRNDHFNFNVDNNSTTKTLKATLSLYRTYGIDNEDIYYLDKDNNVYDLFWSRIDYLLGKNDDWDSCSFYNIDGFLCDMIDIDDKSAEKSDIIDLNRSKSDLNTTIEKIIIKKSYKAKEKKESNDKLSTQTIVQPQKYATGNGIKDKDITLENYKIDKYEKYEKKVQNIENQNNDLNTTGK
jgi:hypothetical protein